MTGQVRCLTTLEARPEKNQQQKGTGQPRKRYRESSNNNSKDRRQENQEHPRPVLSFGTDALIGSESHVNSPRNIEARPTPHQPEQEQQQNKQQNQSHPKPQWRKSFQNDTTSTDCDTSHSSAPSSGMQGTEIQSVTTVSGVDSTIICGTGPNQDEENGFGMFDDFVEDWNGFDLSNSMLTAETAGIHEDFDKHVSNIETQALNPPLLPNGNVVIEEAQQFPCQPIEQTSHVDSTLDRIMMLSVSLSQESRCAKKHAMPGPRLKAVLNKTLQQSEAFLALLKYLVSLAADRPSQEMHIQVPRKRNDNSPDSNLSGSSRRPSTDFNIDTQAVLQLLSCNTALLSNYEVIGSLLYDMVTTRVGESANILPHLPEVYMDGFSAVSSSLQVKLLTQICVHMILEMQAGLEDIRKSGLLTLVSSQLYDSLFGHDKDRQADQENGNVLTRHVVQLMHKIAKALGHSLR